MTDDVQMKFSHTLEDNFFPDFDRIKSHVLEVPLHETLSEEASETPLAWSLMFMVAISRYK